MSFCKSLSNAISFRIPGNSNSLVFNPCCLYDFYIPFHPTTFAKERKKYTEATTFLPGCSKCELKEKTHGTSLRINSNRDMPSGLENEIYKLEVVLDTTCNAACIQCSGSQSSLWRKELSNNIYHIQQETQIDKNIQIIKNTVDLSKVGFFHFWGGEPLLTDTHLKLLKEIEHPEKTSIAYTTNGSIVPDQETLSLWSKFKSVKIGISIDGMDDKFHYIRWPLSWEKVKRNLVEFKNNCPDNVVFHINCCIIPLNAYYVLDLGEWLGYNFSSSKTGRRVSYNFIRGEGPLDIACTPLELREAIWKILPDNHDVANVLRKVPVIDYSKMIAHLDYWDPRRKLNWRETFPEIVKYFEH